MLLCRELAREARCLEVPFSFPSARTARAYLSGRNIVPEYAVYDDTWGP